MELIEQVKAESFYQPGIEIGLLGGGQLGMMLCQAAIDLNIKVSVLDPDHECSCKSLAYRHEIGSFKDYDTVLKFGRQYPVITIEIEGVNTEALKQLESEGKSVFPKPDHIALIKDKRKQKELFSTLAIPTADYLILGHMDEIANHLDRLPAILKAAIDGYDGRGVVKITGDNWQEEAFDGPAVLEQSVTISKEFSLIISRNLSGEIAIYDAIEQVFHPTKHILEFLIAPAELEVSQLLTARAIAETIVNSLDYVGLLAIEFFVDEAGQVLVNEMAPRPHNSGHHTIRACGTSQFEQHLRAILNLPPGSAETLCHGAMVNILGSEDYSGPAKYSGIDQALELGGTYPFLYGKSESRPFRKMGHVTIIGQTREEVMKKARSLKIETKPFDNKPVM